MLSTDVKKYIILQHSGAVTHINEHEQTLVLAGLAQGVKGFTIQGSWISAGSVSDVMGLDDYYRKFPDKAPPTLKEFKAEETKPYKSLEEQILADSGRRNGLVKGIKAFIDEYEALGDRAENARAILERWESGVKTNTLEAEISYHQKTVEKYKNGKRSTNKQIAASEEAHYQHALKKLQELNVMA